MKSVCRLGVVEFDFKVFSFRPKGYILHMKDWNSKNHRAGGGVLLAIKNEYSSEYVIVVQYIHEISM
jgi:hypothetical protein